ncbi:MAG TPA: HAMP domain-containing sensor histidine kinase [Gemmatimonadaceae bacterium]|nr:HAMP domain-containing sensor histidine kinase [Gemmatimonadaceae bacterium]
MDRDEEELLHSAALQNATSILLARQRAEQELRRTKVELELKMAELARSLATTEASLRERDRARLAADEARLAAQSANEAKSRFLNMMSHELRTPLGAIGGYAALLEEEIPGVLTEEQRKYIGRIRHNQAHLLQLVNELLDLGKIESGRFALNPGIFPIRPVIDNVYSMIEPQIRASGMRLEVDAGDPSLLFYADRDRVEQILLNLLSNSVKFTPAGGTVRISVGVEPDTIRVCVEDTGVGIPADQLEAVFEAFFQVNASRNRDHGGSGLGLAISRRLAREMSGDLTVKSTLGEGCTFTLSLPRSLS